MNILVTPKLGNFQPQSIQMITVGWCSNCNALLFYNLANGIFVSSIDYKLNVTSGVHWLKNQPSFFLYYLDESTSIFAPKLPWTHQCIHKCIRLHLLLWFFGITSIHIPAIDTVAFKGVSISEYMANLLSATPYFRELIITFLD